MPLIGERQFSRQLTGLNSWRITTMIAANISECLYLILRSDIIIRGINVIPMNSQVNKT